MPLTIKTHGEIAPRLIVAASRFCERAESAANVRHAVRVWLVDTDVIYVDGERAAGCFSYDAQTCEILVAMGENKTNERLKHTIAHELGHYQLWRDGDDTTNEEQAEWFAGRLLQSVRR